MLPYHSSLKGQTQFPNKKGHVSKTPSPPHVGKTKEGGKMGKSQVQVVSPVRKHEEGGGHGMDGGMMMCQGGLMNIDLETYGQGHMVASTYDVGLT